jgi:hypothetical protein
MLALMDEDAKFNRRVFMAAAGLTAVSTTAVFKLMPPPANVSFPPEGFALDLCFNVPSVDTGAA